jgi:hypothetical protein
MGVFYLSKCDNPFSSISLSFEPPHLNFYRNLKMEIPANTEVSLNYLAGYPRRINS